MYVRESVSKCELSSCFLFLGRCWTKFFGAEVVWYILASMCVNWEVDQLFRSHQSHFVDYSCCDFLDWTNRWGWPQTSSICCKYVYSLTLDNECDQGWKDQQWRTHWEKIKVLKHENLVGVDMFCTQRKGERAELTFFSVNVSLCESLIYLVWVEDVSQVWKHSCCSGKTYHTCLFSGLAFGSLTTSGLLLPLCFLETSTLLLDRCDFPRWI